MLVTLDPSALIWTEGMADWLPLGDLPPPSELPPAPAGTEEAIAAAAAAAEREEDEDELEAGSIKPALAGGGGVWSVSHGELR